MNCPTKSCAHGFLMHMRMNMPLKLNWSWKYLFPFWGCLRCNYCYSCHVLPFFKNQIRTNKKRGSTWKKWKDYKNIRRWEVNFYWWKPWTWITIWPGRSSAILAWFKTTCITQECKRAFKTPNTAWKNLCKWSPTKKQNMKKLKITWLFLELS